MLAPKKTASLKTAGSHPVKTFAGRRPGLVQRLPDTSGQQSAELKGSRIASAASLDVGVGTYSAASAPQEYFLAQPC
jgi:hypothetical protein